MTAAAPTSSPLTQTAPVKGGGAVGLTRGVDSVLWDIILTRNSLLEVFPANLVYFVLGRHSGLVPYFFPGVLSVLLFLAWRGGRPWFQWITLAGAVFANVVLLLWIPYTYSGGGGPIGNRYFMGLYPLLLFVTPPLRSALPAIAAMAIGGLFTAQAGAEPVLRELPAGRARQARAVALAADREEHAQRPADQRDAGAGPHPARRRAAHLSLLPRRQRLPAAKGSGSG